ncbi:hypothetical protein [uncultured Mucilaginibacter sp.]|uniref:hypothetical protein n=1 Tax=uncultured Mucilaginibacter sp. TaxID=797541 RepID=UPI0025CB94D1|nr:hypothetical protein [uncultured Mucilaginibacter sp.]
MSWNILVIGICVLLLLFSAWKEYQRENKTHMLLRVIAVVVAVSALACIILPLMYKTNQTVADNHRGILLTDGFSTDSLKKYPDVPVFTASAAMKKEYPKAILLQTLSLIKTGYPQLTQIQVLGYGLDEDGLKRLNMPVLFNQPAKPAGLSSVSWNGDLKAGESLKVQGKFNNPDGKTYTILLKGLNVTLDSITQKTNGDFELHTIPKTTGNVVYNLIVTDGKDTIENNALPLHIEAVKPVRVLILSSSPDFENRFLKNWLSANGYTVYTRTAISKDKFSTEAVNAKQIPLTNLGTGTLQNFDVLVSDASALQALLVPEALALKQQVTQSGLGLIVRADSAAKTTSWFQSSFPLVKTSGQTQNAAALQISGQTAATEKLKIDPVGIVYKQGTQVLVSDGQSKALVSSTLSGAGKLVFSALGNTYNWMLGGDENDYTAYWSLLINKAARKAAVQKSLSLITDIPQTNHETTLQVLSASAPDSVKLNDLQPAFAQNAEIPFLWQAKFWPGRSGWQKVANGDAKMNDVYVYGENDWKNIKNLHKIFVTNSYANKNLLNYTHVQQKEQAITQPVPKIWFFLLFLTACSFLWAEAKFWAV